MAAANATSRTVHVRKPFKTIIEDPTTVDIDLDRRIQFLHPGYSAPNNVLFAMLANDGPHGGLHHATALIACGLLAGNDWDGHLSLSGSGDPVEEGPDDLLSKLEYYYFPSDPDPATVPSTPAYPIYTCFDDWPFPHNKLPRAWTEIYSDRDLTSSGTQNTNQLFGHVKGRDGTCRLTDCRSGTEVAHIIFERDNQWFSRNNMGRYGSDSTMGTSVKDAANLTLLRADVHKCFDNFEWTMAPKPSIPPDENSPAGHKLVFHLIQPRRDLGQSFHNKAMHPMHGVSVHFLFARFAQTIFQQIQGFLQGGLNRHVWSVKVEDGAAPRIERIWKSAADCAGKTTKYTSRTPSPVKQGIPSKGSKRPREIIDAEENHSIDSGTERASSTHSPPLKRLKSASRSVSSSSTSISTTSAPTSRRPCSRSLKAVLPSPTPYRWNPPCTCPTPKQPENNLDDSNFDNARDSKTVVPLPVSPASPTTSTHSQHYFSNNYRYCASNQCRNYVEARRVGRLKEMALSDERSRSGTEMGWAEHLAWAERKASGSDVFHGEEETDRWAWIHGREIVDGSAATEA